MSLLEGDIAFILISSALVMLMTPGLAYFYGGLLRKKNVSSMLMWCVAALAVVSVVWVLWGYSLAFDPFGSPFIGGLAWALFYGVDLTPFWLYSETIPHIAYAIFQGMFACITVALIFGAFAERVKFSSFVIFMIIWITVVYCPVAHWVWSIGGWLRGPGWLVGSFISDWLSNWLSGLGVSDLLVPYVVPHMMGYITLGTLDFAGGTVVHINAGMSALAAAIVVGPRKGYGKDPMVPHNLTYVVLGTVLLWFGWFGFNAGSALSANDLAANAFLTTNTAAAAAAVSWLVISWITRGRPSIIGTCTGAVVGLVAITPASGFVSVQYAIIIGAVASPLAYGAIRLKDRLHIDDSLDVWACHGVGGIWGALATGIFASTLINPGGTNGLLFGNLSQLAMQAFSVAVVAGFSFVVTLVILKVIDIVLGLRVSTKEEAVGLDLAQHIEEGYG